jgi:hypothetical protein
VVGITSDVLYPLAMQRELVALLPRATLSVVESPQGHDGFLLETAAIGAVVTAALNESVDAAAGTDTDSAAATAARLARASVSADVGAPPLVSDDDTPPPNDAHVLLSPMPTAAVLSLYITAVEAAKRKAANIEGARTMGCLGAVAW